MSTVIDSLVQVGRSRWLLATHPARVVSAWKPHEVTASLEAVDADVHAHARYALGFVRYEASAAFGLHVRDGDADLPLVHFALYDAASVQVINRLPPSGTYRIEGLTPSVSREAFAHALDRIHDYLAAGDTYQVNYTFRMRGGFSGDPLALLSDLGAAQGGVYGAFLRFDDHSICSASPELFFRRQGRQIQARPMKGTIRRGRWTEEDRRQAERLRASPKEQAENVMIVDMVRNDLGRVADVGTVTVPELFTVEDYPNAWQMTSTVEARSSARLPEIFAAMFPSASVTGAPKIRTMELISALETAPRGVYTGAIGYVEPNGDAQFNVAIRTAVVDHRAGTLEFGVGSGIVWDSATEREYEECLLKASVLGRQTPRFELLETMRWCPQEGFALLTRHLARLQESARYFRFCCEPDAVREALDRAVSGCSSPQRVRLLVAEDGAVRTEQAPLGEDTQPVHVRLASAPVDPDDVFLFHKTTHRVQYTRESSSDGREVILWNPSDEVTESTIANLVIEIGGRRVTPAVSCGLLPGTMRAELLDKGEIQEGKVTIEQFKSAANVWLINSVRGWRRAAVTE